MTEPDNLEPWQRVADELVTYEANWEVGMMCSMGYVGRWMEAEPACREIARLREELQLMERKVITCGVAATNPDAALTLRADYMKWNSPQAEAVRRLRAEVAAVRQTFDSVQADMLGKWEGLCAAIGVNPVEAQWLIESQASNIAIDAAECVKLRAEVERLRAQAQRASEAPELPAPAAGRPPAG